MAQITLREFLQETEDAISSNRIDDALAHCQRMLASFPEALEIQRLLGEVYLTQGRLEEAQQIFDWVLTNDPENVVAYCNRAHLSERMSEYDVALDCYQQAYELSRGNPHIREEFNRLSQKTGQKGFMLSRAGLARLYMRGNMLSQALQEWEVVLDATPDRLDARLGQLETYWRSGLLESVEQSTKQLLQDVPGCLKALLLQASVVAPKDNHSSQELLYRAKALDPDYIMAQELFADALVSHPDDPFLQQLKNAPTLLSEATTSATTPPQYTEQQQNALASISDTVNTLSEAFQPISNGTPLPASWNTPLQEMKSAQPAQEIPDDSQEHSPEPWELLQDALNQFDTNGAPIGVNSATSYDAGLPLWENTPSSVELSQPSLELSQSASRLLSMQQESINLSGRGSNLWGATEEPVLPAAEKVPNPPSWLDRLDTVVKGSDHSALTLEPQSNDGLPLVNASPEQLALPKTTSSEALSPDAFISSSSQKLLPSTTSSEDAEPQPSWFQSANAEKAEDDGESFFGPAWLKSLGATLAEDDAPAAPPAEAQTPHLIQPEYTAREPEEQYATPSVPESNPYESWLQTGLNNSPETPQTMPETNPYESWAQASPNNPLNLQDAPSWLSTQLAPEFQNTPYNEIGSSRENVYGSGTLPPMPSLEQPSQISAEQNLMHTLEDLEQSLRSRGFIPLEPNSLVTLASQQTQESSDPSYGLETPQASEEYETQDSQLSEFGQESQETFATPSLTSALAQLGNFTPESASTVPSLASSFEVLEQHEEPSWLQALKNASATPAEPAVYGDNLRQPSPVEVEPSVAAPPELTQPAAKELPQTTKVPVARGNPLLDDELETTMRRPAVRLQPMQSSASSSQGQRESHIVSRSQSGERIQKAARATKQTNENLSYRERLVRGYQHQLVGDYDEAMQEYRIIIRSATDLLSEVVSNVRALLNLAPNYSAGYRVLGDAYMRQGEYLQAMEAYNKALTMTKKVKSQV